MEKEGISRGNRRWRALSAIALVAGGVAIAGSPAEAADNPYWSYRGFVWAGQPTTAWYTGDPNYSWDARTSITRNYLGDYTVRFPGQASAGGVVHVSGYGTDPNSCRVVSWGPDPAAVDQLANVRCFAASGALADSRFTASYYRAGRSSTARLAYVWANSPTSATYVPSTTYQHNGGRGLITIRRSAVGRWDVTIPGMATDGGNVQVTAYGPNAARCKVSGWGPSASNEVVGVACFAPNGASMDVPFTLSFADRVSLFGLSGSEQVAAHAWAPLTGGLPSAYSWHYRGLGNSITRGPTGMSTLHVPDAAFPPTHVQVTAYGYDSSHCKVASWALNPDRRVDINMRCFTADGRAINSAYSAAYVSQIIPW